jgi:hypothetical protein
MLTTARREKSPSAAQRETPHVGIFWLARMTEGEARLLASCPMDQAEPYGDCQNYGAGQRRKFQLSLS